MCWVYHEIKKTVPSSNDSACDISRTADKMCQECYINKYCKSRNIVSNELMQKMMQDFDVIITWHISHSNSTCTLAITSVNSASSYPKWILPIFNLFYWNLSESFRLSYEPVYLVYTLSVTWFCDSCEPWSTCWCFVKTKILSVFQLTWLL